MSHDRKFDRIRRRRRPGALESLRWMLEQADFRVKAFRSSREFLDSYRPEETGCLVLDVRMPEMDGLALQQALRERKIRLPIIFMTAYGDVPTCARAFRGGAVDFLEKPVNDKVLLDHIERLIAQEAASPRQQRRRLFRRPPEPAHADRNRGPGGLDRGQEHQGDRPGEKGLRADHLAAPGEHLSEDRRGKPRRAGPRRHPVAASTRTASRRSPTVKLRSGRPLTADGRTGRFREVRRYGLPASISREVLRISPASFSCAAGDQPVPARSGHSRRPRRNCRSRPGRRPRQSKAAGSLPC